MLDLLRPIYRKTAAYGHFGRDEPEFTWESDRSRRSAARRRRAGRVESRARRSRRMRRALEALRRDRTARRQPRRRRHAQLSRHAVALLALAGCASLQPQSPTLVRATQDGGAVRLHTGDTLVVALDASPTAGHALARPRPMQGAVLQHGRQWPTCCRSSSPQGAVGAPNDTVYRFRAQRSRQDDARAGADCRPTRRRHAERTVHYEVSVDAAAGRISRGLGENALK